MRALAIVSLAFLVGQGTRQGSPEEHLPANITRLTHFGERASWSPDDTRIAFMEKSFGDAYEVDVATRTIRLLTHYPHAGFLRVQFLPNGDYFVIGARTFADIQTTRSPDQEMWILKGSAKPGDRPLALDHKISEGVAISKRSMKIAWSNTRGQYPDLLAQDESVIFTADIVYDGAQPRLVNRKEVIRAKAPSARSRRRTFAGTTPSSSTPATDRRLQTSSASTSPAEESRSTGRSAASTTKSRESFRMASTRSSSRAAISSSRIRTTSTSGS